MKHLATVEDIVDQLSSDLAERGFEKIPAQQGEIVRYAKLNDPIGFQVGIEQDCNDKEEPGFIQVYLPLLFNVPAGVEPYIAKNLFPYQYERLLFRKTSIYHRGFTLEENILGTPPNQRMSSLFHVGFEKSKTSRDLMRGVLREVIDYLGNFFSVQLKMITNTNHF